MLSAAGASSVFRSIDARLSVQALTRWLVIPPRRNRGARRCPPALLSLTAARTPSPGLHPPTGRAAATDERILPRTRRGPPAPPRGPEWRVTLGATGATETPTQDHLGKRGRGQVGGQSHRGRSDYLQPLRGGRRQEAEPRTRQGQFDTAETRRLPPCAGDCEGTNRPDTNCAIRGGGKGINSATREGKFATRGLSYHRSSRAATRTAMSPPARLERPTGSTASLAVHAGGQISPLVEDAEDVYTRIDTRSRRLSESNVREAQWVSLLGQHSPADTNASKTFTCCCG